MEKVVECIFSGITLKEFLLINNHKKQHLSVNEKIYIK